MANALKTFTSEGKAIKTSTPQTKRTPGKTEVKNQAGGFVFKVTDKDRLERFLILGTDGGGYYATEQAMTADNVKFVRKMISKDERLVVDTLVDVSVNGRAYRNTPAIFTLAVVLTEGEDKAYARAAVTKVIRTGTHLFEFAGFLDDLGGWGRAKRKAIAEWYTSKDADTLAYQAVKYRQRNGWTHRDLFRKSHPEGVDQAVGKFILGRLDSGTTHQSEIIAGFQAAQAAETVADTLQVIDRFKNLPWEALRTEHLKDAAVWKKLFYNGQLNGQALVRNITRLSRNNAFKDMQFAADYAARLTDAEMIARTRLHPINFLNALTVHADGQTVRDSYGERRKDWTTVPQIVDALNEGFHLSFKSVEPAGKRTMIAIDVSPSMSAKVLGLDLSASQVSAAVAMTVARTEPAHVIKGFASGRGYGYRRTAGADGISDLAISAKTNLASAMKLMQNANWGGTDCAAPMLWAAQNNVEVDTFVVITDNDTWAGNIKPFQALKQYRDKTGIPARLAVLGTTATKFTIADPSDKGMMDFAGFDSNAPRALTDFSAGRI